MAKYLDREEFERADDFGVGEPNPWNRFFTGSSYLKVLEQAGEVGVINVTFEPGCRNFWHVHNADAHGGQLLVCTAGEGWYQEWGSPARSLRAGDVVIIPTGVKHWHGAKADSWFSHVALELPGENTSTEWCEPVSDEDYAAL